MQNTAKRYTKQEKELLLNLVKVGAQNNIHPSVVAQAIAPVLRRKPSAIESQMVIQRTEWIKNLQEEMGLTYRKVKFEDDFVNGIETEYENAAEPSWVENVTVIPPAQPAEETNATGETPPIQDETDKQPEEPTNEPVMGSEVAVTVCAIKEYGAFVSVDGSSIYGLLHISNIADSFVEKVSDWLYVGQQINAIINRRPDGEYQFDTRNASNPNLLQSV